ncbi:gamma-glutamyltransferase family protein [Desulfurococcus mucosus]|uniref:gamma-glutamyltransferase family protein n=1 Tax=Desulfurococcus mucosus TaxID=2275 RepID=UPI003B84779E
MLTIAKLGVGVKGVTADHPLAVKAGLEVLEKGGNAFDAAIAVSAVLSVVQPQMGGPGGDGFLLGFIGDDIVAYASSGRSPSGFDPERFITEKPLKGPLTVTVPGLVYLWGVVNEEYGTLDLATLLKPAISLAYNGFHAGYTLAKAVKSVEKDLAGFKWAKYYKGIGLGSRVVNKEMARTLRLIASRGWEEFYHGKLAEEIVDELQDQGVGIGLDDMMDHEGYRVEPLKLEVEDLVLYELPPNTQGASTLQLISALYEEGLDKLEFRDPRRVEAWSRPVEAVYAFRDEYLGDPDHMAIDVGEYLTYTRVKEMVYRGVGRPSGGGDTTFFIVSDGDSLVGFIQSLFHPFGSGLMAGGFPVQNRGIGFARTTGLPNSPAPRKLPLHTLSILGVSGGREKYIIGCVGGDYRPQLHLRVYENLFVYGMDPVEAVNAPRFIYTEPRGRQEVVVEEPLKPTTPAGITVKLVEYFGSHGHVHVAVYDGVKTLLVNDPRSEGIALALSN